MKTTKMSLANIQGKLSRAEMKMIMAGSDGDGDGTGNPCAGKHDGDTCTFNSGPCNQHQGICRTLPSGGLGCAGGC